MRYKGIIVKGPSLSGCLNIGHRVLKRDIFDLQYEVLQNSRRGFFGIGQRPFIVKIPV